ncbi:MAG: NAD-dependent succinate-semialdehyde dehydrogenase [Candidatus Omnitrophica bacterium]|nr:NAD-dependent succinate-semialdehyde dehydrogenase [Candidatus Omnitrophota bacterium]
MPPLIQSALASVNPATGERIRSYPEHTPREIEAMILRGHKAFTAWSRTPVSQRCKMIAQAAAFLRRQKDSYAELMAREMGKPLAQGRAEIEKCAWACGYTADNAAQFLAPEQVKTEASKSYVVFQALGVVLAIMPWNFPFWQAFRAAVPALAAGNAVILKHASNVSGCALEIESLFQRAGFPEGVFQAALVESNRVGSLIEHPLIRGVTLTGSSGAGMDVASQAGSYLKKTVLELGGSDPYIILEDADLKSAAQACAVSRMINSGQSCIAAKRFIVVRAVRNEFEKLFVQNMEAQKMGDPFEEGVTVGPLARLDLRDQLHAQVQETIHQGAGLLLGGRIPPLKGAYYPPTVLTDVPEGSPAYEEEIFGPVAAIIPVEDAAQAVDVANRSPFGLGAAIFTADRKRGEQMAVEDLEAGSCFVNAHVQSDPRLPFGGIKDSGYGRELSVFGIREFVNIKTVVVA